MNNSFTLFPDLLPPSPVGESGRTQTDVMERSNEFMQPLGQVGSSSSNQQSNAAPARAMTGFIDFIDLDAYEEPNERSHQFMQPRGRVGSSSSNQQSNNAPERQTAGLIDFIDLEADEEPKTENPIVPPQLPRPEESNFICPICMNTISEPTATKCGHIFCKNCITDAFAVKKKCPTCRQKLSKNSMLRVYLP